MYIYYFCIHFLHFLINLNLNKFLALKYKVPTDAFNSIYESIMGQTITLNSGSGMQFSLNDQKWMTLLKVLSNFKLPEIYYHYLNYIPTDSEEVRRFIVNSIPTQQ